MAWISEHRNIWRLGALLGVVAAIVGPWAFTSDGIGPTETCDIPLVLLENDRCVKLVSGASVSAFIASASAQISWDLLAGRAALADRGSETIGLALFTACGFLLLLPVLSTLLLVVGRDRQLRALHLVAWGLAGLVALILAVILGAQGLHVKLWGPWLFVGLAALALALELLAQANSSHLA